MLPWQESLCRQCDCIPLLMCLTKSKDVWYVIKADAVKRLPNHKNILCWSICYCWHETWLAEHVVQTLATVRCTPSTHQHRKACISSLAALDMQLAVQTAPSCSGKPHVCTHLFMTMMQTPPCTALLRFHSAQILLIVLTNCATVLFVICSILAFLIFSFSSC